MQVDIDITTRICGIPINIDREMGFDLVSEPGKCLCRKRTRRINS
jgi:hypothetical protein